MLSTYIFQIECFDIRFVLLTFQRVRNPRQFANFLARGHRRDVCYFARFQLLDYFRLWNAHFGNMWLFQLEARSTNTIKYNKKIYIFFVRRVSYLISVFDRGWLTIHARQIGYNADLSPYLAKSTLRSKSFMMKLLWSLGSASNGGESFLKRFGGRPRHGRNGAFGSYEMVCMFFGGRPRAGGKGGGELLSDCSSSRPP